MATAIPATPPPAPITSEQVRKVIEALEDPQYKWRSIEGIAASTAIPKETVHEIVKFLGSEGVVIQSSINADDGSELFTTRSHYRQKASFWSRFTAALRNRA